MTYHSREVDDNGDVEGVKLGSRPDAAKLQELRSVEDASRNDNLSRSIDGAGTSDSSRPRAGVRTVEILAFEVLHANGAGPRARLVEHNLAHLHVCLSVYQQLLVGMRGLKCLTYQRV